MTLENFRSLLNRVVDLNRAAGEGFKHAAELTNNPELREWFTYRQLERDMMADQINESVSTFKTANEAEPPTSASVHRVWMTFRKKISSNEDKVILEECKRGEEELLERYDEVLKRSPFVTRIQIILAEHKQLLLQSIEHIEKKIRILELTD